MRTSTRFQKGRGVSEDCKANRETSSQLLRILWMYFMTLAGFPAFRGIPGAKPLLGVRLPNSWTN